jgi:phosphatidyl-myo-inositol dimannoside synthase
LRVLLLTTDAYGGHGGIALYNRDIVQALVEKPEIEEVVVVPRTLAMPPENVPPKVRFRSKAAAGGKVRYSLHALRAAMNHYDIVICGHIHLLPLAVLLNLFIRAPLVLMVYGIDVWQQPYQRARSWLNRVSAIWSISGITQDRMDVWAKQPEDKYSILPNAIHLEHYGLAAKRTDLVNRYGLKGSKVIMTLARLSAAERYKGIDEVIELLPSLLTAEPTLKYMVVGDGDDRHRLELKVKSLGLAETVTFTGRVDESDKPDFLRLADTFVMPSKGEGFGFVFLEALACGVPAVGSLTDGSREALRDGMLGELVDPEDPQSIESGILSALLKRKEIPAGIEYFAWPEFSARVSQSIRTLVGQPR